jgi:hypothetical protein
LQETTKVLELMEEDDVRWDGCGSEPAGEYTCVYEKGN